MAETNGFGAIQTLSNQILLRWNKTKIEHCHCNGKSHNLLVLTIISNLNFFIRSPFRSWYCLTSQQLVLIRSVDDSCGIAFKTVKRTIRTLCLLHTGWTTFSTKKKHFYPCNSNFDRTILIFFVSFSVWTSVSTCAIALQSWWMERFDALAQFKIWKIHLDWVFSFTSFTMNGHRSTIARI